MVVGGATVVVGVPSGLKDALVSTLTVKPVVSNVLPLSEARQAHELLEAGHTRGKIVLRVVVE